MRKICHITKSFYLIVILDPTLLNSTSLTHVTIEEEYLRGNVDSWQGVPFHASLDSEWTVNFSFYTSHITSFLFVSYFLVYIMGAFLSPSSRLDCPI